MVIFRGLRIRLWRHRNQWAWSLFSILSNSSTCRGSPQCTEDQQPVHSALGWEQEICVPVGFWLWYSWAEHSSLRKEEHWAPSVEPSWKTLATYPTELEGERVSGGRHSDRPISTISLSLQKLEKYCLTWLSNTAFSPDHPSSLPPLSPLLRKFTPELCALLEKRV